MADTKLSALTELAAPPAANDEVYIRDVSEAAAQESKRITVANLQDHTPKAHSLASHSTKAHSELSDAPEGAHHIKFTTTEHSSIGNGAPHHTKFTDANARAAAVQDAVYGAGWNGDTTHAPSQNAVWDKIESLGGAGASLTVAETEVFNGTAPTSWTDLNLSGTVGANVALVLLKITDATDIIGATSVRKDGDTDEFYGSVTNAGGSALAYVLQGVHAVFVVATSSSGIIEWKCNSARGSTTVDIIAYIK